MYDKFCVILKRAVAKNNAKCQILSLTVMGMSCHAWSYTERRFACTQILETCVKNCYAPFYDVLAKSDLWIELIRMAADTSVGRVRFGMRCRRHAQHGEAADRTLLQVDAEVRDKILTMCEDYAKVLPQKEFRDSYELLLVSGFRGGPRRRCTLVPESERISSFRSLLV